NVGFRQLVNGAIEAMTDPDAENPPNQIPIAAPVGLDIAGARQAVGVDLIERTYRVYELLDFSLLPFIP
ncbi:MAG: hypothetical protein O2856_19515, partial [Planctomycetota bacterium]|nr:hypothetical protein [Planctomycetota bacterium]